MAYTDVDVDLDSVINIILPLELYDLPSFPAEDSFTRLRDLLLSHFTAKNHVITPAFLFSISEILSFHFQFCHKNILPLVLRCLRTWRILSPEEKTQHALEGLALDLAAPVNARSCPIEPRTIPPRLRIRWIGVESQSESMPATPLPGRVLMQQTDRGPSISVSPTCPNVPFHEMASYRSGCCACRRPRNHCRAENTPGPTTLTVNLPPISQTATIPHADLPTMLPPPPPRKSIRTTRKHDNDENVPALPSSAATSLLPSIKIGSGDVPPLSALRPAITRKSATTHQAPLSRSSFSHNSASSNSKSTVKSSNSSLSTQNALIKALVASRSSSSVVLVTAQPYAPARPAPHLAFKTGPTNLKPRAPPSPSRASKSKPGKTQGPAILIPSAKGLN